MYFKNYPLNLFSIRNSYRGPFIIFGFAISHNNYKLMKGEDENSKMNIMKNPSMYMYCLLDIFNIEAAIQPQLSLQIK